MSRTLHLALLVLLGLCAVSVLAVDTEVSLQATSSELTPELTAHLSAVASAVEEAEALVDAPVNEQEMDNEYEAAFLEVEAQVEGEAETETDADAEMEESLGLDADSEDDALFMEIDAAASSDVDVDADAEHELDVEVEHETDAEAGSVTVADAETETEVDHSQDADPIVTEQMETEAALHDFGFLEGEAEAETETETDSDAEAEVDAEAEAEADAEAELDAEMEAEAGVAAGEEQTAVTKCGKKITWERNQEPNPEAALVETDVDSDAGADEEADVPAARSLAESGSFADMESEVAMEQPAAPNTIPLGRACSTGGVCRTPRDCPQAANNWVYTLCLRGNVCCVPKTPARPATPPTPQPRPTPPQPRPTPTPTPRPVTPTPGRPSGVSPLPPMPPTTRAGWYPTALDHSAGFTRGAPFPPGGKYRIVLHTTEGPIGTSIDVPERYWKMKRTPPNPHFTLNFRNNVFTVVQHVPITHASAALARTAAPDRAGQFCQTNNQHAIQIEIMGMAAEADKFPQAYLDHIAQLLKWIKQQTNVQLVTPTTGWLPYPASAEQSRVRMTCAQWADFNGICGHQHVPNNSHGDPGAINIQYLMDKMRA